jgi:hypothetical protein
MTQRIGAAVIWALVLVLVVFPLAGCPRSQTTSTTSSRSSAVSLAPSPAADSLARTDPAVWAAVRFEQAHCSWDWRRPLQTYIAAQQALATLGYGRQLAAAADPASWQQEVVVGKQQVRCTVSAPTRLGGAPSTSTSVYVRMSVHEHVTSTMGSFDGGARIASWFVSLVDGRWLVAGAFIGG